MGEYISLSTDPANVLCKDCTESCKQSNKVVVIMCPHKKTKEKK